MGKETSEEIHQRAQRDMRYFGVHEQELWEQYGGDQWVAIYNEQVVGVHGDLDALMIELEEKGIPPGEATKSMPYPIRTTGNPNGNESPNQ